MFLFPFKCCVGRNPYNGYKYLCGANSQGVFLMQWYDPLNKFMLLKVSRFSAVHKFEHCVYCILDNWWKCRRMFDKLTATRPFFLSTLTATLRTRPASSR